MASCWSVTGLLLVAAAMVASLISLAAPFWLYQKNVIGGTRHFGLWGECGAVKERDCEWFWENDFSWEKNQAVWFKACQGLFAFGCATLIISFFLVSANMCCRCCDYLCINRTLCGLLLFAFLELTIAIGLYGGYANREMGADLSGNHKFDWGYWIGICGAGLDLLALIVFFMNTCCRGD